MQPRRDRIHPRSVDTRDQPEPMVLHLEKLPLPGLPRDHGEMPRRDVRIHLGCTVRRRVRRRDVSESCESLFAVHVHRLCSGRG